MAKKRAAIGELIKSDMSRRTIGEESIIAEEAKPVSTGPVKKPVEKEPTLPFEKPVKPEQPSDSQAANFEAFIAAQIQSFGLTDEAVLQNFYEFLKSQAMRYIRGFDAGRRFHG